MDIVGEHVDSLNTAETREEVLEALGNIFPKSYSDRDYRSAKAIVYDLMDIAESCVIRDDLSPKYVYVMGQMLYFYRDGINDDIELGCDQDSLIPDEIKEILQPLNEIDEYDENENLNDDILDLLYIRDWFTDPNAIIMDFEDEYDGDFTSREMLEFMIKGYTNCPEVFIYKDAELDEILDLVPNDLRDKGIQTKIARYKDRKTSKTSKKDKWYQKIAWEIIIPICVGVAVAAICFLLGII